MNCPMDCNTCCGDGFCDAGLGETCATCAEDCGTCCGDDYCDIPLGENCKNCAEDCGQCCGNGICDSDLGENCLNCRTDCKTCKTDENDLKPPKQFGWIPPDNSIVLQSFDLKFNLDEPGACKWCENDYNYSQCGHRCIGDGTKNILCHIEGLQLGNVKVHITCKDLSGNADTGKSNTDLSYFVVERFDNLNYSDTDLINSSKDWLLFSPNATVTKESQGKKAEEEVVPGMVIDINKIGSPEKKNETGNLLGSGGFGKYLPLPVRQTLGSILNALPLPIRENFGGISYAMIILALVVAAVLLVYAPKKGREIAAEKLKEREKEGKAQKVSELEARKVELRKKLLNLREKAVAGLTAKQIAQRKAYTEELHEIEDKLLKEDDYLDELNVRVDKALEQAKKGIPSKEIMKQLVEEGYTKKEIEIIKRAFQRRKVKDN